MKTVNLVIGSLLLLTVFMYVNQKPVVELFLGYVVPATTEKTPDVAPSDEYNKAAPIVAGVLGTLFGLVALFFLYLLFASRR